ncbi:bile acid:sodium symporter family protein [Hoeflea poritis]|uniref:Bile acid:sodium symporter family protein n=1 Tax=Hoeflea poritis TaxID=2993659 RepID=A0ABT4VNW4_9HYPH|nr:bile acid:sodium symporter family protein [Hoeflea poritis]MDA4845797.1 bile acid:sodium symporter family protein [Hoeflea poritis]
MGILLSVFLPLSLAFIMFSLGLGLTVADFARVVARPKAFFAGAASQIVVLPVVAFLLLQLFRLPPELAVGVMILSFCPGGVTSNIITKLAGGAVALSVTLTGVVSLVSVITVPLLVAWAADHFMGQAAPDINVTALALAMFAITAVPVAIGVALRHFAASLADRIEMPVSRIALVLFVVIVIGALAANWSLFVANLVLLGPLLVVLNIVLLMLGLGIARVMGLDHADGVAIAIETGVQNSTLGITVGSLIVEAASGLPPFSLPSGVYGITMYFVAVPFIYLMRRRA